ncbi:RNA polymerase sigma factor [Raineya orbicola]|uniref:Sigma70-ECF: RNA polymerase sigma factor, sigma-70 family n=1 Tax=Raineya orbicola TaxID=2016530 RepID=A0A2N3I7N4_9BACT|nr:sigma-70 family RNA polymerase sigma factor [Raineya orbicola]PKQ66305.1 sigma70-ECF: RNA polymerase sigma factor, sigma-70 family [Raineya orbicola]
MAKFLLSIKAQMNEALQHSEADIISALRQGDSKALEIIYKQHYPAVLHFIIQNNGTDQDAKDLYQEAVIILYEKLRQEHFLLTCQIKTFLYSVCRKLWLKRLREKGKYFGKLEDFESFLPLEEDELGIEENEQKLGAMATAMEQLGEPCRTLLKDFYISGLTMQDIAEKMGYTNADNAKNQKYKCLVRLKKLFFEKYKKFEV